MITIRQQCAMLVKEPSAMDLAETAARMCYRSYRPDKDDYDQTKFLKALASKGHLTPFEHSWLCVPISDDHLDAKDKQQLEHIAQMSGRPRSDVEWDIILDTCVASMRTFIEVLGVDAAFELFKDHDMRCNGYYTFDIITNRAIANQLIRHRSLSFDNTWELPEFSVNQESLRWVKQEDPSVCLGKEYVDILNNDPGTKQDWMHSITQSFETYRHLCDRYSKQFARSVLPLCTTTHIMMTGNGHTWVKFLELRLGQGAEPPAKELAHDIFDQLKPFLTADDGYDPEKEPFRSALFGPGTVS